MNTVHIPESRANRYAKQIYIITFINHFGGNCDCDMSHDFSGHGNFCIYKNGNSVTCGGFCTKQACCLMSGEYCRLVHLCSTTMLY